MPLYKHSITGKLMEAQESFAAIFPEGTFELISEESAGEERARLLQEALDDKVDPPGSGSVEE